MAAVLACGPEAVLSHRAAVALWELRPTPGGAIDVTIPGRTRRGQAGIRVHGVRALHDQDRAEVHGIPVTSVHRTLLDYAEVAHRQPIRLALEAAERRDLLDLNVLDELIDRSRGRHGLKPLRAALGELRGPAPWTQSELENRFLALIREAATPEPHVNVVVAGLLVDFFWPRPRLVVEVDGYGFHKTRTAFEGDRARDAKLQIARYRVLRATYQRIVHEPEALVRDLRSLLAA